MISIFGWICICFFMLVIKYAFLKPTEDKRLYRLYEARDNVAIAAVEGKISQEAKEYRFVIGSINEELYYMKNNYDFSVLINNILFQPESAKRRFDYMMELVKEYDFLEKNYHISKAYFQESLKFRLFFLVFFIVKPINYALDLLLIILKLCRRITAWGAEVADGTEKRISIMLEISNSYNEFKKSYPNRA